MKRYIAAGLLLLILLILAPRPPSLSSSTLSAQPAGAKALFLFLNETGPAAERLFTPVNSLDRGRTDQVLVLAAPPAFDGAEDLLHWVRAGNRVIYFDAAGSPAEKFMRLAGATPLQQNAAELWRRVEPAAVALGDREYLISRRSPPRFSFPNQAERFGCGVVRLVTGTGDIWYFPDAEPLSNEQIDKHDNLALLLRLVAGKTRVLFDEFHHGHAAPPPADVEALLTACYIFAALLIAWLVLGALSRAVRFGPPAKVEHLSQPSTADHLRALGLLYHDSSCGSLLRLYLDNWRERARAVTSLPVTASVQEQLADLQRRGKEFSMGNALAAAAAVDALPDGQRGDFPRCISPLEQSLGRPQS